MEILLMGLAAIVGYIAWWSYDSGKREGSRKGYNIGRRHGRRRRR